MTLFFGVLFWLNSFLAAVNLAFIVFNKPMPISFFGLASGLMGAAFAFWGKHAVH